MSQSIKDILTIVVLVKNEERNLRLCLDCIKDFPHVVIVDSGSTDGTLAIAAELHREVVQFAWNGHFPKKRNWLLRTYAFKTPWVLFLDADERVTPDWIAATERTLNEAGGPEIPTEQRLDAFICFYDNWFLGRMLRHGDIMQKTAVLRIGFGEYEHIEEDHWSRLDMEIHEHIQVTGRIGTINARLEHHDKRSLESYTRKHNEYVQWEANRCLALQGDYAQLTARQKLKYSHIGCWWFGLVYFVLSYFLLGGFLDGRPGLIFALGKRRYFNAVRRRIKELTAHRRKYGDAAPAPADTPTDLAVIILQKDEILHIRRCLEHLAPLRPKQIFVVDCFSTDGSAALAANLGAILVQHAWPGTQAAQFNWALNTLPFEANWILRLDADEYLTPDAIDGLRRLMATGRPPASDSPKAYSFELKRRFNGREIRHGTSGIRMVRLFQRGFGRYSDALMDERILVDGTVEDFDGAFYDDNLNTFEWWKDKHRGYAKREARQALTESYQDKRKATYYRLPPYLRAVFYWAYRYFIRLGFLDGLTGWRWHFWQGLWYRCLVDREIAALKKQSRPPL